MNIIRKKQKDQDVDPLLSIFDSIFDEIIVLDKNYRIIDVNKTFCLKYGVSKDETIGRKCYEVTHNREKNCKAPECKCPVEDVLKTGQFSETIHIHNINGEEMYVELLAYPIKTKDGKIKQIVKIGRDITERKKIEQEIKQSELNMKTILSNVDDSIIVISKDHKILYMNRKAEEEFGSHLSGNICYNVLMNRDKVCENCTFTKLTTSNNRVINFESKIIEPLTNENKFYEYRCTPIANFNGQPAIVDIIRDITYRKNAEKILIDSEKKFREAYNRANFYKDLFAHDINNIFQSIESSMELLSLYLKDFKRNENIEELINIAIEQVIRGANLVSNVRKFSEIEESGLSITSIEVNEVLKRVIQYVIKSYHGKKINIQVYPPNKKFYVKANDLLLDVFENILINAIRHNNHQIIEIIIKVSKVQKNNIKYLKLEFIDNGIGIPDNMKEKIFLRAEKKVRNNISMGLGLSLVKKIIEEYNGQIWVEDRVKGDYREGSKFIILIEISFPKMNMDILSKININIY
ncbi:MAG: PAS domain S-box protein [Promethearchaeota archaeon]